MNRSTRLIILGVLLLLLAAVRIVMASSHASSGIELSEMDADQLQQTLTAQVTPTAPAAYVISASTRTAVPTVSAVGTPSLPVQSTLPASQSPKASPAGANNVQPDGFLAPSAPQRTVVADTAGAPARIMIPAIGLDAPVTKAKYRKILLQGDVFDQWVAPDQFAAGWIATSASFGEAGNTVLVGHHNDFGEVFGRLVDLNVGDMIILFSNSSSRAYRITNKMILQELDVPVSQRIENARWIGRSNDERLTLVTCWPKETNTHRLVIVASPN